MQARFSIAHFYFNNLTRLFPICIMYLGELMREWQETILCEASQFQALF